MKAQKSDSSMASIDFGDAFKDDFSDAFDVDVWKDQEVDDAFNPSGTTAKAFPIAHDTETTKQISTSERSSSQHNHRPHQGEKIRPGDRRGGVKKQASFKDRSSQPNHFLVEQNVHDSHPPESKEISDRSARSHKSNSSSESKDSNINRGKNVDRRPRMVRNPSAVSKQPGRQRSLPGKGTSMRNLVSLLHSSIDSLECDLHDSGNLDSSEFASKSADYPQHGEQGSEENHDGGNSPNMAVRKNTTARSDEETPSRTSRQVVKADPTNSEELKPISNREFEKPASTIRTRGVEKSRSLRSRHVLKADHADDFNCHDSVLASTSDSGAPSPQRGPRRTHSMKSRRNVSSHSQHDVDVGQGEGEVDGERRPTSSRELRGVQRSYSGAKAPSRAHSYRSRAVRKSKSADTTLEEMAAAMSSSSTSEEAQKTGVAPTSPKMETRRGNAPGAISVRRVLPSASRSGQGLQRMSRAHRTTSTRVIHSEET